MMKNAFITDGEWHDTSVGRAFAHQTAAGTYFAILSGSFAHNNARVDFYEMADNLPSYNRHGQLVVERDAFLSIDLVDDPSVDYKVLGRRVWHDARRKLLEAQAA